MAIEILQKSPSSLRANDRIYVLTDQLVYKSFPAGAKQSSIHDPLYTKMKTARLLFSITFTSVNRESTGHGLDFGGPSTRYLMGNILMRQLS